MNTQTYAKKICSENFTTRNTATVQDNNETIVNSEEKGHQIMERHNSGSKQIILQKRANSKQEQFMMSAKIDGAHPKSQPKQQDTASFNIDSIKIQSTCREGTTPTLGDSQWHQSSRRIPRLNVPSSQMKSARENNMHRFNLKRVSVSCRQFNNLPQAN